MARSIIQSESLNLADDFAFTGTVSGAGGGKILQIQYTQYTGTTSDAMTDGNHYTIDELAVNITPSSTSSIIRLEAFVYGEWSTDAVIWNSNWYFLRDSTKLRAPADGTAARGIAMGTWRSIAGDNNDSTPEGTAYSYFDTPSTTSQITYKVGVYVSATATWYTNKTVNAANNNHGFERGISSIIATEIAG